MALLHVVPCSNMSEAQVRASLDNRRIGAGRVDLATITAMTTYLNAQETHWQRMPMLDLNIAE